MAICIQIVIWTNYKELGDTADLAHCWWYSIGWWVSKEGLYYENEEPI